MELRHLRHLAAVVELGNLSRAAEVLAISQPALTRSIKTLEEIVGGTLIERRPRGVVPTREGEALYQSAKIILEETKRAREELVRLRSGRRNAVSVGIAPMFAEEVMDAVLVEYCRRRPTLSLTVTEGLLESLLVALDERQLDVVFCNLPAVALPANLRAEPMLEVHSILVARPDHPLARSSEVSREELAQARWAVVNQAHMRDTLDHFFSAQAVRPPEPTVQTNSLPLIRSLVLQDDFITILPHHLVRSQIRRGALKRIRTAGAELVRSAGVITRQDAWRDEEVGHFVEIARMVSRSAHGL